MKVSLLAINSYDVRVEVFYLRKEMVNDMRIDNAVEDVTANEAEITIDGCESARHEGPALAIIVGDILVSMVEVRNGD